MTETNRIEYKQELTESLEKEVVAFLNYHEGGVVYIGIDKSGKAIGVKDADGDMLRIKDRLKNNISPSCMGLFELVHETKKAKEIIKVTIASGPEKPYYIKKQGMSERGCFIRIFKDLDLVEHLGSGVPRILESYSRDCFKFTDNFVRMSFPGAILADSNQLREEQLASATIANIDTDAIGGAIGGAIDDLTDRQITVLETILGNNKISYRAIAQQLSINESAVLKHIEQLKQKGYISRKGGTRGYWKVIKKKKP